MADEIIKELWKIKDNIARESGYDIDALINLLQSRKSGQKGQPVGAPAEKKSPPASPIKHKAGE